VVEIWQVDASGSYIHSRSGDRGKRDKNFQGYGRFLTGSKGEYYFRTIKPVGYQTRTPHIHVIVKKGDRRLLTTQLYVKGEFVGGCDIIREMFQAGELQTHLTANGIVQQKTAEA